MKARCHSGQTISIAACTIDKSRFAKRSAPPRQQLSAALSRMRIERASRVPCGLRAPAADGLHQASARRIRSAAFCLSLIRQRAIFFSQMVRSCVGAVMPLMTRDPGGAREFATEAPSGGELSDS